MGKENNFVVETEGNCFLCSKPILTEHRPSEKSQPRIPVSELEKPLYSLQCFSRYLKMDMSKIFNQNQPIPQHLLKKVNDSKLMVSLCLECAKLSEEFSGVYGQLERIQMQVAALVKIIYAKLTTNCVQRLTSSKVVEVDNVVGKREIAEILRKEASQNCSRKLNELRPKLKIQKLTTKQVNAKMMKLQLVIHKQMKSQLRTDSENVEVRDADIDALELEHPPSEIPSDNDEGGDPSSGSDHSSSDDDEEKESSVPAKNDDSAREIEKPEGGEKVKCFKNVVSTSSKSSKSVGRLGKQHATLNPTTGKSKCNVCSKEFSCNKATFDHYRAAHLNIRYRCRICQKKFKYSAGYYTHVRNFHRGDPNGGSDLSSFVDNEEENESFVSAQNDDSGMQNENPKGEKLQNCVTAKGTPKYSEPLGKQHATLDPLTGKSKCNVCSKEFSSNIATYTHYKAAHLNVRYRCRMCEKEFKYRGGYNRHVRAYHQGITFTCHLCNKIFKVKDRLTNHLQTCLGTEPSKNIGHPSNSGKGLVKSKRGLTPPLENLEVLGAGKNIKKELFKFGKEHVTLNPTTGKSKCNVCSKEFSCNLATYTHYKAIHLNVRYKCRICDKLFRYRCGVNIHMRSEHKGETFMCQLCGKNLKQKRGLDKHLKICGKKDLTKNTCHCAQCGRGFTRKTTLQQHVKIVHLKLKNYACSTCNKKFSLRHHLKTHRCKGDGNE